MTCGELYWSQEELTCVDVEPFAGCGTVVTYKQLSTPAS